MAASSIYGGHCGAAHASARRAPCPLPSQLSEVTTVGHVHASRTLAFTPKRGSIAIARAITEGNDRFVAPPYGESEPDGASSWSEEEGAPQPGMAVHEYIPASSMTFDEVDFNIDEIMDTLECDLVQQFDKGADYTIYDENVVFVDPISKVVGKAPYATMLSTIQIANFTMFECTEYDLVSLEQVAKETPVEGNFLPRTDFVCREEAVAAVRTTWRATGTAKWGGKMVITGSDIFRLSSAGLVVSHESAWEEAPYAVVKDILPGQLRQAVDTIESSTKPFVNPLIIAARPLLKPIMKFLPPPRIFTGANPEIKDKF